ncbi:MAG: nucleotide exchange factor GrpE [Muribaculaceae bacterium]|nr:nucleotide exchange factor GrpE [Muribaculaceae bacterium]
MSYAGLCIRLRRIFNKSWRDFCKRNNKHTTAMDTNNHYQNNESEQTSGFSNEELNQEAQGAEISDVTPDAETVEEAEAEEEVNTLESQVESLQQQVEKEKKEYLFLMAEFDNFRKRTLREKSEIIKNAGENVLKGLLPIMDDFERGIKAAETSEDTDVVKEGMTLIYNKLKKYLAMNGVKEIDPNDDIFDTEKHEAISVVPVADEEKKGKILDTVEKGYTINDKVLRHAKVVVAQ